ncbi:MAG TPA: polymer-forming cytoskeletal protein [Pyrinomonadaceae bacterium]|nr:polymer-forming cytoskeletal protein [Pyrinomonadaceae bacterium]
MIRMGRSSRSDVPETNDYNNGVSSSAPSSYQYGGESQSAASPRVVTDSESIARDIKEGRLSGFVGHGTVLTGETTFQMMLRVDGHLTGSVASDGGTLIVGTNGQVDANVSVGVATINGVVNGDVVASEKIQLGRTARVMGNVATPRLIIEEGAVFEGGCSMMRAREEEENAATAAAQAQYQPAETSSYSTSSVSSVDDDDDDDDFLSSADAEEEEDESVTV